MEFEWDDVTRRSNLMKHGLDLLRASELFEGLVVTFEDTRRPYGEPRMLAVGISRGRVLTCVYTDRIADDGGVRRRIIWLRPASRKERRDYGDRASPPAR